MEMDTAEHAAFDVRDMIDRAASVLELAEAAKRALDRGAIGEAAEFLAAAKEPTGWIETKRRWALEKLTA